MRVLHVTTSVVGDDDVVDEYKGEAVGFMTEASGALVVYRRPNELWAAYAPGSWEVVRDVSDHQVPA